MIKYENVKAKGNHNRSVDGVLKKNTDNKNLPPNINVKYYPDGITVRGYRVRMTIRSKVYDKSFIKHEVYDLEQLLAFAIRHRAELEKFFQDKDYNMKKITDY